MKKKKVSLIIPTYNRAEELNLTLASIRKQEIAEGLGYEMEVIVADDGSCDETKGVVDSYQNHLDIHYLYQEDQGFRVSKVRNLGAQNATGNILVFVDSGILLEKHCVQNHILVHENEEGNAAVIGYIYATDYNMLEADVAAIRSMIHHESLEDVFSYAKGHCMWDGREKVYQRHGDQLSKWPAPFAVYWSGNISLKRDWFFEVGGFDENFTFWGGEDNELGIRLWRKGSIFILERSVESIHYPSKVTKQVKTAEEVSKSAISAKEYICEKHPLEEVRLFKDHSFTEVNALLGLEELT